MAVVPIIVLYSVLLAQRGNKLEILWDDPLNMNMVVAPILKHLEAFAPDPLSGSIGAAGIKHSGMRRCYDEVAGKAAFRRDLSASPRGL